VEESANSADYDFRSIMHYNGLDALGNPQITMVGGTPLPQMIGPPRGADCDRLRFPQPALPEPRDHPSQQQRAGRRGRHRPRGCDLELAIAEGSPSEPIVTATVRMKSGRVRIYAYRINTSDLSIREPANSGDSMGNATMVNSARAPSGHLIVGCATDGDRDLLLIPFSVSRDGQTMTRLTGKEAKAGRIRGLRMSVNASGFQWHRRDGQRGCAAGRSTLGRPDYDGAA
jgi:hypothetical protein